MRTGVRLTNAGLGVTAVAFVLGVAVIPTHVSFGAGSIRCGTVLHPDRLIEISPACGPAGAHQLRAVLVLVAVLATVATGPLLIGWWRPGRSTPALGAWAVLLVLVALFGLAYLGVDEYHPASTFFDL